MDKKQKDKLKKESKSVIIVVVLILMFGGYLADEGTLPMSTSISIVALTVILAAVTMILLAFIASKRSIQKKIDPFSSVKKHVSFQPTEHEHPNSEPCNVPMDARAKYFAQIDGFYKNGLIDMNEYKALHEKYEKIK